MKLNFTVLSICVFSAVSSAALAQTGFVDNSERTLRCDEESNRDSGRVQSCEVREQSLVSTGSLHIDAGPNGGVSVKGWSQPGVLVRSKVEAWSNSPSDSQALRSAVQVHAASGEVTANGPKTDGEGGWSVSYEVFVPHNTALDLQTSNGGLHVSDVEGTMNLHAVNGGLHLARLRGAVTAVTVNGGVRIDLMGDHWEGSGLEASSTNGGVHVSVPQAYSARFEGSTVNGQIRSDFDELPVARELGRSRPQSISGALGGGGAPIHASTTNGSVVFARQ
jgi:DUF4097 and DUF4098 domain-containing protein YvlB